MGVKLPGPELRLYVDASDGERLCSHEGVQVPSNYRPVHFKEHREIELIKTSH